MSATTLGSCETLMAGATMLGRHTGAPQSEELDLDELIKVACPYIVMIRDGTTSWILMRYPFKAYQFLTKVQERKLERLRGKLDMCGHPYAPSSPVPVVEGTPVAQDVDPNTSKHHLHSGT